MRTSLFIIFGFHSHVRTVIATLGGKHGAAGQADKWRHLYAGFTVWLSESEAAGTSISLLSFGMLDIYSLYERYQ